MNSHLFASLWKLLAAASLFLGSTQVGRSQTTLIDVTFPTGMGTAPTFTEIDNGVGTTNTWTQASGVLATSNEANSTVGAVSAATVDISALGSDELVLNFSVASTTFAELHANGMFIGFQDSNAADGTGLWNNHSPSFGLIIGGGGGGITRRAVGPGGNVGPGRYQDLQYGIATVASLQDGFDVTITVDATGWSIAIDGILDVNGIAITGGSETWANSTHDFALFTADMHVGTSVQTRLNDPGTVTLSRISLTQGPPGITFEFKFCGAVFNLDDPNPSATLTWTSQPNTTFSVDYSTDLASWTEIDDGVASGGALTNYVHQLLPGFPQLVAAPRLFYQVRLDP